MIVDLLFDYIKNIFVVELKNFLVTHLFHLLTVAFIIIFDEIIRLATWATVTHREANTSTHTHVEIACRTLANLFPTQSVKMLPEGVKKSTFCLKKIHIYLILIWFYEKYVLSMIFILKSIKIFLRTYYIIIIMLCSSLQH